MNSGGCLKIDFSDALRRLPGPQGEHNVALFEHGSLVVKLSRPRGPDLQMPPSRDEIYVVAQGNGEFVCGGSRTSFSPNDVLFAAAGTEHRFENFSDDFAIWVFFYGPEGGEADRS
ncbi:MAG TPA: cupin domain-containing protein [Pyrinomonadaceae bacterium]|nr:cupin domain-containing protein [Pyrinomonadaceae bacterium]